MKKTAVALISVATVGLFLLVAISSGSAGAASNEKVFVCKYITTPGGGEILQTGNNPISTSVNSVPTYDPNDPAKDQASELVGDEFTDQQGRSLVLVEDTGQVPEPGPEDCPPPIGPCPSGTTTTTVTAPPVTVTQTKTVTVTVSAAAAPLQVEDPCVVTTTVTPTVTETVTKTTTVSTSTPPPPPPPPSTTTPPPHVTTTPATTTATTAPPTTEPPSGGGGGGGGNQPPNQGPNQQPTEPLAFTGFEVQPWMFGAVAALLLLGITMLMRGYAIREEE